MKTSEYIVTLSDSEESRDVETLHFVQSDNA